MSETNVTEIKSFEGHPLADEKARADIDTLSEEVAKLREEGEEDIEMSYKVWGPDTTQAEEGDVILERGTGYLDRNTGELVATSAFVCTNPLIEVWENTKVYAKSLYDLAAGYPIAFYDSEKKLISGVGTGNTSVRITGDQVVPAGTKYVGVTVLPGDPSMYCQITTTKTVKKNTDTTTETLDYSALSSSANHGYYDTNGVFQSTSGWRCTDFISVSGGDTLDVKLTTYNTASAVAYFDINNKYVSGVVGETWSWSTSVYPLETQLKVPNGAYYARVSVFVADYADEQFVTITRSTGNGIKRDLEVLNGKALNVLVLGDSYSRGGEWVQAMKEVVNVKNVVNLSVVSATVKDKHQDRAAYPYSSRPDKGNSSGNTNTLSCQIEKLKRLMAGTDLDEGEERLYTTAAEHPDIIIIEGGMNDSPDADDSVGTYYEQYLHKVNAYYKASSSAAVTQTNVFVKPDLATIDRTCFAGAYRYLCETLHGLFPDAQIFLTTASHMNYYTVDPNVQYGKIADQQRMCANIMSITVIDWHAEGNLNTMMIGLNGSGTQADPYTPVGGDEYTSDKLHPNAKGARRYGRLAGKVIKNRYLGL